VQTRDWSSLPNSRKECRISGAAKLKQSSCPASAFLRFQRNSFSQRWLPVKRHQGENLRLPVRGSPPPKKDGGSLCSSANASPDNIFSRVIRGKPSDASRNFAENHLQRVETSWRSRPHDPAGASLATRRAFSLPGNCSPQGTTLSLPGVYCPPLPMKTP